MNNSHLNFSDGKILILNSESLPALAKVLAAHIRQEMKEMSGKNDTDKIYTLQETAELLNVSISGLYKWRKQKRIKGFTIGNRVYFTHSEIYNLGK